MTDGITLVPGDVLRVERRYLVDGQVSTAMTEGKFAGVERLGSAEHLVIEAEGAVRLVPLSAVSEITVVEAVKRDAPAATPPPAPAWDPAIS